ncbi:MAG TPA: nuclear transport factor 2 family protein [Blastocatellia bacterium]|jgi:ketosteroid isomerase-like protein|nr:nuclear transport factor 2 family protein [Blastocatellia bacterium]
MNLSKLFKHVLTMGVMLLITLSASAQAGGAAARQAQDAEFKSLIDRYYAAWSTMNIDNAAQFYAKDAGLIFFDIAPLQYKGWAEYGEGVKKAFFDVITSGKLTPNNDLKVSRHGNLAWTVVTFHLSATPKAGGSMELDGRHTAIWEKRGGKWVIIHEHISVPLPG